MTMQVDLTLILCAASYTFDLFITESTPIGRSRFSFDQGIPFDLGLTFDSDPVDPYSDGWLGLSLTGRFEQYSNQPHTLDTFVQPSATYIGPPCGYPSYFTQMVTNHLYTIEIDYSTTTTGSVYTSLLWTLQSPDLTLWDISTDANGQIVATSGSSRSPDNFLLTEPDATQVSFAIDDSGQIQTVTPPAAGAAPPPSPLVLYDNVLLDPTYWLVTVNDSGQIVTVQQ
jgi:hypothetical protein